MQPLSYLMSTGGTIWLAACLPLGIILMAACYKIFNKVPAGWFCDYGEEPGEELLSQRVNYKKSGIILSVVVAVCFGLCRLQFNKGFDIYFFALSLFILAAVMISVADFKYTIIPDQFTIFIAIVGIAISVYDLARGYNILHSAWWSPVVGAAIGAAVMLLIDFLGMLVYKKTGMGFGDVKLFGAIGILTGFPGTIYTVILAILTAAICFVVILVISSVRSKRTNKSENISVSESFDELAEKQEEQTDGAASTADVEEIEKAEEIEEDTKGSYLAFGPYIAIAAIAYVVLFDLIYDLAGMYLSLFK